MINRPCRSNVQSGQKSESKVAVENMFFEETKSSLKLVIRFALIEELSSF